MNKKEARKVLAKLLRRYGKNNNELKPLDLNKHLFPAQLEFINHPATRKIVVAGRRSGKSIAAGFYLINECLATSMVDTFYIALTRKSARDILWNHIIDINHRYELGAVFNETRMDITFPNGSRILVAGADTKKDINKFLGKKAKLIIIDEAEYIGNHLRELVVRVLTPTTADFAGSTIVMMSTPGIKKAGYFYDCYSTWDSFNWNLYANYMMPRWARAKNYQQEITKYLAEIRLENGYEETSPEYIREWLGLYVDDFTMSIYPLKDEDIIYKLPEYKHIKYIMGIDFGYSDATAIVIFGYSNESRNLYLVDSFSSSGLAPSQAAEVIKSYYNKYKPIRILGDGGGIGKAYIEEQQIRFQLPIELAEKKDKQRFVELLRDEFNQSHIKILADNQEAIKEIRDYKYLDPKLKVLPDGNDHYCDAMLYAYRTARHYLYKKVMPIEEGSDAWWKQQHDYLAIKQEY